MSIITRREWLHWSAAAAIVPLWGAARAADPYIDAVFADGPPAPTTPGAFTVAVLPDTQHYSEKYPANFTAQTQWILDEQKKRNIAAVLHLGDITNKNSTPEWVNARTSMSLLDGKIPYFFCPGNHDYGKGGGCADRTTGLSEYFPAAKYRKFATFGGTYDREPERMDSSYGFFSAGGREFLVLALEFAPRNDVVRWANTVLANLQKTAVILISHAFVYNDSRRYDWAKYGTKQTWNPHNYPVAKSTMGDVNDGQELWDKLITKHENVVMTVNGHVLGSGLGRLTERTPGGHEVPQMLVNFQMKPNGGDGWLRLLEFLPDRKTVNVVDFSPTRKQCNVSAGNKFSVTMG